MKTIFTFSFLLLISCLGITAQIPITVSEDSVGNGRNTLPGFSVTIPEANYDKTLKLWIKLLETGTKSRVVTANNEMSIFGAKINDISSNPLNVYSKLTSLDSVLRLSVSFELGKDSYIEKVNNKEDFNNVQNFLKQFAKNQYIDVMQDKLSIEDKKLRDIEKELATLEKEKGRLEKTIQSNNSTVAKEKANLALQNDELNTVSAAITDNNSQLSSMDDGPAKEERIKYIKDLEKRKKKALSSIEASENKIKNADDDTFRANGEIPRNESVQDSVKERIVQQEMVVQKYTDKLANIKLY